jgi:hypothetical protein
MYLGATAMFGFRKPTLKSFATQLIERIHRLNPNLNFTADLSNKRIVSSTGGGEVNLANMFTEYAAISKEGRDEHLQAIANIISSAGQELPDDFEAVKPHLMPKIFCRSTFTMQNLLSYR